MRIKIQNILNILLPRHLEYHHIDRNRQNNVIENIIVLEKSLHKKLHRKKYSYITTRREVQEFLREERAGKIFLIRATAKQWRDANEEAK